MKLNLKVRARNPLFWLTFISAIATCSYTIMGCFGVVPAISQDALINAVTAIITALTTLGVLVDPTTKGVGDSELAMTYAQPK